MPTNMPAYAAEKYVSVKMIDLMPDTPLAFDTYMYLPKNNKYVRLSQEGYALTASKLQHYFDRNISSLFIKENDLSKFYKYVSEKMKSLGKEGQRSQTERIHKISSAAHSVISLMASDYSKDKASGLQIVNLCKDIAVEYIDFGKSEKVFKEIMHAKIDGEGLYSHLPNSAAIATILGIALGFKNVEEIAFAGLLHDIGVSQLDHSIVKTEYSCLSRNDQLKYQTHVTHSTRMMRERKLQVSELVYKIVEQHHEQYNGKGYPNKLKGDQICKEAQLLLFSDMFDDMTRMKKDGASMLPKDVIKFFAQSLADPDSLIISPKIVKPLVQLFLVEHNIAK